MNATTIILAVLALAGLGAAAYFAADSMRRRERERRRMAAAQAAVDLSGGTESGDPDPGGVETVYVRRPGRRVVATQVNEGSTAEA